MTQADRKEELFLQKRALETQKNAFYRKQPQFFGFLDLNEQNILHQTLQKLKEEYRSSLAAPVA